MRLLVFEFPFLSDTDGIRYILANIIYHYLTINIFYFKGYLPITYLTTTKGITKFEDTTVIYRC